MLDIVFLKKCGDYTTNFILAADSYKIGQGDQYPAGTKVIHTGIVPRKSWSIVTPVGRLVETVDKVVTLGPQVCAAIIQNVVITNEMIDEAEIEINQQGYDFPRSRWEYIRDLGYLPLEIKALPEGTVVPVGLPLMIIENTDDQAAWLASYVESWTHDIVWTMTTIASKMRVLRKHAENFCVATGGSPEDAEYMIHNFGDRGAGGQDRAIMASIAHIVFFSGSDCTRTNRYIKKLYNTNKPYTSSIDASEHSTMCANSNAKTKDDEGAFEMSLEMLARSVDRAERGIGIPVVSVVIDTYDDERFIKEFVIKNYERIRAIGGKYVCRPDTGDAVAKPIQVVDWLLEGLEGTGDALVNDAGFRCLPSGLGVIQGDGLRFEDVNRIAAAAISGGLAASNFVFGFGGGLTNGSGRDDFSFSMKATARLDKDDVWVDMFKDPKEDRDKRSFQGRMSVFKTSGGEYIAERATTGQGNIDLTEVMEVIYKNGTAKMLTFETVRRNARE